MRAFQHFFHRLILAVWFAWSAPAHAVLTIEDAAVDAVGGPGARPGSAIFGRSAAGTLGSTLNFDRSFMKTLLSLVFLGFGLGAVPRLRAQPIPDALYTAGTTTTDAKGRPWA